MIELLNNCLHGSEIATYLVNDGVLGKCIVKASTTPSGIKNLYNELSGWHWYQKIRYPQKKMDVCNIIQKKDSYLKISIEFIEGFKDDCNKGLEENAGVITKVIDHYCKVWPYYSNNTSPIHGDLSIDNIIYNPDGIHIIDWEHFSKTGGFWGFDAIYIIFETLWFSLRGKRLPTENEMNIIRKNMQILNTDTKLDSKLLKHPLRSIIDFIVENEKIWGTQLLKYPDKFSVLKFSDEQILYIEPLLRFI